MQPKTVRKSVELTTGNVEWYASTFPGGSLSQILDSLLQCFRDTVEHTPIEYAQVAAHILTKELGDGNEPN